LVRTLICTGFMNQYRTVKTKLILASKGAAMGIADIIPGVSGGTIAFISGIYEHLISAIYSVKPVHALSALKLILFFWHRQHRKQALSSLLEIHWSFLLPLFSGAIAAILLMSRIIPYLLEYYPFYMYSLFFGLIACSIPLVYKKMDRDLKSFCLLAVFAVMMFVLMGFTSGFSGSTNLWYVFISGVIAISAMILPGISGSYILLLLGQYTLVLDALRQKDLIFLAVFISGLVIGILSFARVLKYLLKQHHSATFASLTGIMLGSLRAIWPGNFPPQTGITTITILLSLLVMLLGAATILLLSHLSVAVGDPEPPDEDL